MSTAPTPRPQMPPRRAMSAWELAARIQLIAFRAALIKAKTWVGSKFDAHPRPAWLVAHAHSVNQQRVYLMLQAIGQGLYHRGADGGKAHIFGVKLGEWTFKVEVSINALAYLTGLPVSTVAWAIEQLIAKHSVRRFTVDDNAEPKRGSKNRHASIFVLPHADDVLAARRNDPKIATTHGEKDITKSLNWTNGRENSNRLLTPEQAERFGVALVDPRPTHAGEQPTEQYAPPAAGAEIPAAPVAHPEKTAKPARKPIASFGQEMKEKLAYSYKTFENGVAVALTVQQRLDRLNNGNFCDLSGQIIENLEATAASVGNTRFPIFPVTGVEEFCTWRLDERRDRKTKVLNVTYIGPFLVQCALDRDKVAAYLANCEGRLMIVEQEARADIARCLDLCRKHPHDDPTVALWRDSLMQDFPELWAEMSATEGDMRSAGAG